MPARPADAPANVPAVAYWRMSSSPQERSIDQQRSEMLPRCQLAGVAVVQEFRDEAISGGGMRKRDAFLEMLAWCQHRAAAGEPVGAVVCWDTSRFSRADSNETSHYIWEFRRAGVNRLFTWEKWYDFRKEEDRALFNLQQDFTNNRYLRNLSAGVLRGKKDVAVAGYFTGGMVPYGFDRLLLDGRGHVVERIRRGERVALRRKDWHVVLAPIPEDDPDPARQTVRQTARWLFESFAGRSVSFRALARELNDRGIPGPGSHYHRQRQSPGQSRWTVSAVRGILTNPVYAGVYEVGTVGKGQYHRLSGRDIAEVAPNTPRTYHGTDTIRTQLEHGGLVDAALWQAVQAKAQDRSGRRTFVRSGGYVLPGGILHCGHCGGRMHGCTTRPKQGQKVYEYRQYRCSTNQIKPGSCRHYAVHERVILDLLVGQLRTVYLAPERIARLRQELVNRAADRSAAAPAAVRTLIRRRDALDAEVRRAAQNVLRCRDNVDVLNEALSELRAEQVKVARQLEAAERAQAVPADDTAGQIEARLARLETLRGELDDAPPDRLGEVLRQLVSRVDVYFEAETTGRRTWYRFRKGVLKLRPILTVPGNEEHLK
jgi:DNA invertase Pin-like site-specific DNA recombinase